MAREVPLDWSSRRRVWEAMSELFLDTEVRWSFPWVARALLESPYNEEELERIWRFEAVPEFRSNVLMVAGEWAALPFDEARMKRRASRSPSLWARCIPVWPGWLNAQWNEVMALCDRLRPYPAAEREAITLAWRALAEIYLEPPGEDTWTRERAEQSLREGAIDAPTLSRSFAEDIRPIYRRLLIDDERRAESERAASVQRAIDRAVGAT